MTATLGGAEAIAVPSPTALPRLLPTAREDYAAHLTRLGPLPWTASPVRRSPAPLLTMIDEAGLVGRGGAAFPTARKLRTVATGRNPVVVVNAMEGEPTSIKDRALLALAPHLVLDGALSVARALAASEVVVCVARAEEAAADPVGGLEAGARSVATAMRERHDVGDVRITLARPPHRYVSGESSALARWLDGGPALPAHRRLPLARQGVSNRPTALDNAETFAHIALIARFGPDWFRALGGEDLTGTALVTVSGAVARAGVTEVPLGAPLAQVIAAAGGASEPVGALLFGGYGGTWIGADECAGLRVGLRPGPGIAPIGPGIVCVLPSSVCGLAETSRIVSFMAAEGAGQCGPCIHGLPALAGALDRLARPHSRADADAARHQLWRWCDQIAGRGACNHPDGVVRLVRSALHAFADDVEHHAGGSSCGRDTGLLFVPPSQP